MVYKNVVLVGEVSAQQALMVLRCLGALMVYKNVVLVGEVSPQQALMVLRCLGALMVKEHPEERQKLFEQLWEKLPQLGTTTTLIPLLNCHRCLANC